MKKKELKDKRETAALLCMLALAALPALPVLWFLCWLDEKRTEWLWTRAYKAQHGGTNGL